MTAPFPSSEPDLDAMATAALHALVYRELLPALILREGREAAEARLLRFKVLGGLGPAATADFLQELIAATPATRDREHLRVDVAIDPLMGQMPDASPLPATQETLDALLHGAGTSAFCLVCNTAHWRIERLNYDRSRIAFVSMIDAAAATIAGLVPPGSKVGLLATARMVASGLYQDALAAVGLEAVVPDPRGQDRVNAVIYGGRVEGRLHAGVKGGETSETATALLQGVVDELVGNADVAAFCLACTELPLVFGPQLNGAIRGDGHGRPVVNATRALAAQFLRQALLIQARALLAAVPAAPASS